MLLMLVVVAVILVVSSSLHHGAGMSSESHYYHDDYANYETGDCVVTSLTSPPVYVHAYSVTSSCDGDDDDVISASSSRQVHVVNVMTSSPVPSPRRHHHHIRRVRVRLLPAANNTARSAVNDVVVVLASGDDVTWKLRMTSDVQRAELWILNGSRAVVDEQQVTVHYFTLPLLTADTLVTWTRRHLGSVTSLSQPILSRTISLPVVLSADSECPGEMIGLPVQGCVMAHNAHINGRDVHVIEVTSSLAGRVTSSVGVSLRATSSHRRHVVLLLKMTSDNDVTFDVSTYGLRGTLDVIVSTRSGNASALGNKQ